MALGLKPTLGSVEHDRVLCVLTAGLVEGLRTTLRRGITVLARSRNIKLQTLSVKRLVELEAGGGRVEADFLTNALLKIVSSGLVLPLALSIG